MCGLLAQARQRLGNRPGGQPGGQQRPDLPDGPHIGFGVDPVSAGQSRRVLAMSGQISTGLGTWPDVVARPARLLAAAPTRVGL
ncbi:MAG TPA: hypothetical protein VHX59_10130, partial [Mycobacteriales bacterium]|nr:hypothetical protein [Mycobacteriales bacterium]